MQRICQNCQQSKTIPTEILRQSAWCRTCVTHYRQTGESRVPVLHALAPKVKKP